VGSEADAAGLLRRQLEALYPAGSEARGSLGSVLGRLRNRVLGAAEAQALAGDLIARVTSVETTRVAKSVAGRAVDTIEGARPASRFEAVLRGQTAPVADRARATAPARVETSPPLRAQKNPSVREVLSSARAYESLSVTTPGLQSVARHFSTIGASLLRTREALAGASREKAPVRYWLRAVARHVGAIEAHTQAAEGRLVREVVAARPRTSVLAGIAEAQGELRAVSPRAAEARSALAEVAGKARHVDVRAAIREVDVVARESARAEGELGLVEGRVRVLGDGASASGGLTEEDLRNLGTALASSQPPPQILWTEEAVNAASERGRAQGGVSDTDGQAHFELAGRLLQGATGSAALTAADLAAALKEAGLPLDKVDPQQLDAAARYVSAATSGGDQQDRLRKTLDGFQVLTRVGAPRLSRQEMVNELWAAAKVPGHALQKLNDAEVAKVLQQVTAAVNGGPGEHQLKVGSHNLKFTVGANGSVGASSCKKPGFFSRVGSALKKVAPIALTVMSFIPVTAPFAIAANAALSAYRAVRAGSLLGIATAAVGMVGAGAGLIASQALAGTAALATKVSNVATGVSRTLQGISSLKQGNLLGGLAAIGSGIAGGIAEFAKKAGDGLSRASAKLADASTKLALAGRGASAVDGYRSASRAVSDAKTALRQAEASGDRAAIAAARGRLQQAESAKTSAVLGTVASAASLAADARASYSRQPDQAVDTPPARLSLDVALRTAWRGLEVARGIHDRDFAAAGASALGLAAVGRQALGAEPSKGLGLTDAANMADAALGYHQASRGEGAANAAVAEAERQLRTARLGGDGEAIRLAEVKLQEARKTREGALMGGIAAGESLLRTAEGIGLKFRASRAGASADAAATPELREKTQKEIDRAAAKLQEAEEAQQRWQAQAADSTASPEVRAAARAGMEALERAKKAYSRAISEAKGDPQRLQAATDAFEGVRRGIGDAVLQATTRGAATPSAAVAGSGRPPLAALRQPEKVGRATVRPGATVWELSQRTGVPVERILEFNAQMGQPIDPGRLQVGQQILVPLAAGEVTFRPRSAEEVQRMVDQAMLEKELASMSPPRVLSPEVGRPAAASDPRARALDLLKNDRAIIAEDQRSSEFSFISPSTWVDTKAEEARYAARDVFSRAVDRYEDLLQDPGTSREALRAAETDKLRALNAYNQARGVTDQAAAQANYLTPVTELAQNSQDALHDLNRGARTAMADALTKAGVPSALVGAATLPSHVFDSIVDLDAGVAKGAVQLVDSMAGIVAHPVQTAQGVGSLIDRAAQATPEGRSLELLFEAAYGKYDSPQEFLAAYQERVNPLSVAAAQVELAVDVGKGMFAESIRLAQEGKYAEAVGTLGGQNLDVVFGAGIISKGGKFRAAAEAADAAGTASRATSGATRAAEASARTADAAGDAARGLGRGLEAESRAATEAAGGARQAAASAASGVERTRAGTGVDRIATESTGGVKAIQIGTRNLPAAENPWIKYQKHVTGKPFEEIWQHGAEKVYLDGRRAGYTVEAKWTGKNDAAWRSSPYNPRSEFYNEAKTIEQAQSLLDLNKATRGKGVAYAVSNEAARVHFELLFRRYFPAQPIRVWFVPGTGM
jgi:LysM repeat protein